MARIAGIVLLLALGCRPFNSIRIDSPVSGQLVDDPVLAMSAVVAKTFDPATVELSVDGVGLIGALGLVPPFVDASGTVWIGGNPILVTGFTYDPTVPGQVKRIDVQLSALPPGVHALHLEGLRNGTTWIEDDVQFDQVVSLASVAHDFPAAGHSDPTAVTSGGLAHASFGGRLAGPPVGSPQVGTLRAGLPAVAGGIAAQP